MKLTAPGLKFDLSDFGFVYGVLLALSLTLINPWGNPFGGIWTMPKVYVLIVLALLTWERAARAGVGCGRGRVVTQLLLNRWGGRHDGE